VSVLAIEARSLFLSRASGRLVLAVNPSFNFCKRHDGLGGEGFEGCGEESKSGRTSSSQSAFGRVEEDDSGVTLITGVIFWGAGAYLGSGMVLRLIIGIRGESAKYTRCKLFCLLSR